MIHVIHTFRATVTPEVAWSRLADLEWLTTVNPFHRRLGFVCEQRSGAGTRMVVDHGLFIGPVSQRIVRITHWEEGGRIRWTDVDPKYPTYLFPHSEQFVLAPSDDGGTLVSDELVGTLNLRLAIFGRFADWLAQTVLVTPVVYWQSRKLRRRLEAVEST